MENKKTADIVVNANEVSRIAKGVVLRGDMSSRNDIRVDGIVEGTLYSEGKIVVGETAVIKGAVLCTNTDLWGRIDGDVYTRDILSLKESSTVNGSIHVRKLQVEMGAQINATCKMITEEEYDKECKAVVKATLPSGEPAAPATGKK